MTIYKDTIMSTALNISDIIWEILRHLNFKDRVNAAGVNSIFYNVYNTRNLLPVHINGIDIVLEKELVLKEMLESPERVCVLNAPPSYGKTIIGMLLAFNGYNIGDNINTNERVVIMMPPKAIRHWAEQFIKFWPNSIIKKDTINSPVVIINAGSYDFSAVSDKNKVFIVSLGLYATIRFNDYFNDFTVIIDEYHTNRRCMNRLYMNTRVKKIYALSATNIIPLRGDPIMLSLNRIDINHQILHDVTPVGNITPLWGERYNELKNALNKHDKLLILYTSTEYDWQDPRLSNIKVYKFKKALSKIHSFHKHNGKCILVAQYKDADTSISINADAAILLDTSDISYARFHQSISRIIRITNNKDIVNIYCHLHDIQDYSNLAVMYCKLKYGILLVKSDINKRARESMYRIDYKHLSLIQLLFYLMPKSRKLKNIYIKEGFL